jgi:hypothetical protein
MLLGLIGTQAGAEFGMARVTLAHHRLAEVPKSDLRRQLDRRRIRASLSGDSRRAIIRHMEQRISLVSMTWGGHDGFKRLSAGAGRRWRKPSFSRRVA